MKLLGVVFILAVAACGGSSSKPPAAPTAPAGDDGRVARGPSAEEIDRCARLYVITSRCGITDDYEFGWIKADIKPATPDEATQWCTVPSLVDDDGMNALPVSLLAPDALAKVEAASQEDCAAVFAALDEVDERISPAGHDPSGEEGP